MNRQFDVALVIAVVFAINCVVVKIITYERLPYGLRAALGSFFLFIMLVLAASISTYGR